MQFFSSEQKLVSHLKKKATINAVFRRRTFRFMQSLWLRFNHVTSHPICGFLRLKEGFVSQPNPPGPLNNSPPPCSPALQPPLQKPPIDHSEFWKLFPRTPWVLAKAQKPRVPTPHRIYWTLNEGGTCQVRFWASWQFRESVRVNE